MDPDTFAQRVRAYCQALDGSVTSWGRTPKRNRLVGGVEASPHLVWVGADVVLDVAHPLELRVEVAHTHGLALIAEADHDHLQPLEWIP